MIQINRPVVEKYRVFGKTSEKPLERKGLERKPFVEPPLEEKKEAVKLDISKEDLEEAIKISNKRIFKDNNRFEFKLHERTKRMMVKLVDKDTDEVVREIPPEKLLDLVASIWDLVGILVDERG